jgi:hypothetical protein
MPQRIAIRWLSFGKLNHQRILVCFATVCVLPLTLALSPGYRGEGREVWTAHTGVGAGCTKKCAHRVCAPAAAGIAKTNGAERAGDRSRVAGRSSAWPTMLRGSASRFVKKVCPSIYIAGA